MKRTPLQIIEKEDFIYFKHIILRFNVPDRHNVIYIPEMLEFIPNGVPVIKEFDVNRVLGKVKFEYNSHNQSLNGLFTLSKIKLLKWGITSLNGFYPSLLFKEAKYKDKPTIKYKSYVLTISEKENPDIGIPCFHIKEETHE